jgi:hypothetical protein
MCKKYTITIKSPSRKVEKFLGEPVEETARALKCMVREKGLKGTKIDVKKSNK